MTRQAWTHDEDQRLAELWKAAPTRAVARQLGRSVSSVKNRINVLGLKKPRGLDAWQTAWLIALYPHVSTGLVAFALGCREHTAYQAANRLGLNKSAEYLASHESGRMRKCAQRGTGTQFKRGLIPHNKGVKGWQAGGRAKETQFKKGNRPQTHQPIGTISFSQDGFPRRKIAEPNVWEYCHRAEWIKHHGPIPKGHVVTFKNGDRRNWQIDNLELLTFAQNLDKMRQRMLAQYGPELVATKKALTRLRNHLNRKAEHDPAHGNP